MTSGFFALLDDVATFAVRSAEEHWNVDDDGNSRGRGDSDYPFSGEPLVTEDVEDGFAR